MKFAPVSAIVLTLSALSLSALAAPPQGKPHAGHFFQKMDKNGDGKITTEEVTALSDEHFNRLDTNGDGVVTREESEAAHQKMREEFAKRHAEKKQKRAPEGKEKRERTHRGPAQGPRGDFFAKLDKDGDGKITREESRQAALERFQKFDLNQDGVVTKEEMREARAAFHKKMKENKKSS